MNEYIKKDLQFILSHMEQASICYLSELSTLLQLVSLTHSYCSQFCLMEDFSIVLTSLLGSDVSTAGQNKLNQWIQKSIYSLLSSSAYDDMKKVRFLSFHNS